MALTAAAQSGLDARQFSKYWRVESEATDYSVTFQGDTCELVAPKGLTLWRRQAMRADCAVEYDVQVMSDRLSDMNCFWMASDPAATDIWKRMAWRSGIFARCYTLQMYYLGYGGNYNSTTRFRRYTGDERGVDSAAYRPPILTEYTDSTHLLRPAHWYHLRLQTVGGRTQMYVDGECIVDYLDPEPITSGWFGFRTTLSRIRIANFCMEQVEQPSLQTGIPLHWICYGSDAMLAERSHAVPTSFGIPFAPGELKDVSRLALSDGTESEAWVNARWPDGSVKWAGMAATVPIGRQLCVIASPSLRRGTEGGSPGEGVFFSRRGDTLIDSIVIAGRKLTGAVRLVATTTDDSFTGRLDSAVVEHSGRVLSVVRLDGHHHSETGSRRWLPFTVRFYLYKDSRQVKIVHTFVFDGDEQRDFITSLGIRFGVPMRLEPYNRYMAFATTLPQTTPEGDNVCGIWTEPVQPLDGRRTLTNREAQQWQMDGRRIPAYADMNDRDRALIDNWAAWDGFRLSQLTDNSFSIRKRALSPSVLKGKGGGSSPWIGTFTGQRAPGYVFLGDAQGGLGVYMQDFWQSYPSSIQVDHARSSEAQLTMYIWSPEAEPMNLCHYDTVAHGLDASYEDVQPGLSTPYGIARTTTLWLVPQADYPGREEVSRQAACLYEAPRLLPTPGYLHAKQAFGVWSLPCSSSEGREESVNSKQSVEDRLSRYLDFYRDAIEQHKWYGFWNYGDMMHAYDPERQEWRYDVGGYAWDNTELATPMWLWYSFLRTGRADVWRMAEAMTRHNSEVDTYHLGPLAPLGSRHNVSHWGCGAKEARISQSAFLRFYYYLTGGDERTSDLMHAQTDADTLLYHLDPMRLAEPREKFPCTAPARLRFGPDWLAYAGNWMTEWERTGNTRYRDKIMAGLQSAAAMKHGLFTGNKAWGYDPATGVMTYEGPQNLMNTNHLATIMGGFEVMNELLPLMSIDDYLETKEKQSFEDIWLDHALRYKQMARDVSRNHFPVRRLMAYGAWQTRSPQLAKEAWADLWGRIEHEEAPAFRIERMMPPFVPAPRDYWHGLTTNDAALWSLDAIYMLETIGSMGK